MKKKCSTPNLIKVVSLSTVMATLLSSVSPVFAANLAITGQTVQSTNGGDVLYPYGSHGSIVFAGDDDFCGADNVIGRGGKQQQTIIDDRRITAEQQYDRFVGEKVFGGREPYGTTTEQLIWAGDGYTVSRNGRILGGYMGAPTGGIVDAKPEAFGIYSFATGCGSSATGNYSTVFGAGATAKAGGAQAFGVSALAGGIASVAMGVGSEASGKSSVAIGGLATALGTNSVALGTKVKAESNYAIAIGTDAEALGSGAIAIGGRRSDRTEENNPNRKVIANAENAIAIGTQAYAETEDSVAIGVNSQVLVKDGVAVGGGSISDRNKNVAGYDPATDKGTTKTGIAWKSTTGAFSVGEVGGRGNGTLTRQITGVAAGSEDTDAVNVAQLKAMKDLVSGAWKLSANDANPTDVNPGSTIDFSVKDTKVGKDNLKIERNTVDNKHKIEFTLSDTLKLTKVTTGQSSMSDDGFIIENGPKMILDGIDAGDKQITNVADGEEDTDAVNYKQLKEVKTVAEKGWKLSVDGNDSTDVKAGSTVDLIAGETRGINSKNITIKKDNDNKVTFSLNDQIKLTTVTTGNSTMSDEGFKFVNGGPSITANGIDAAKQKITNVADGEKDTDAVNYKQLKAVQEATKTSWQLAVNGGDATAIGPNGTVNFQSADNDGTKNIKIEKDSDHNVTFDLADDIQVMTVTAGESVMSAVGFGFTEGNGPSITVQGIHAGNKTIKGVAAGEEDTDAVNFSQLKKIEGMISEAGGWKLSVDGNNSTDVKAGSTVDLVAAVGEDGSKNIKIAKDSNKVTFSLSDTLKLTSVTTGNSIMNNDGFTFIDGNGPSITLNGINAGDKKITGVTKGEKDTDAVNYKQLKDVKTLAENGWKLSVDGSNATDVKAGSTVDLVAGASDDGSKNIKIVKDNNKVTFSLNDQIKLTSVTTGNSIMSNDGFKFVDGGPSITVDGIDAYNKKITKVANGTDDTDAVNFKQLKDVTAGIKTGWKLSVEDGEATDVEAGSTVKFVAVKHKDDDNNESENTNIKITRGDNNKVKFDLSEYIKVGRVETGDSRMSNAGFMIKDGPNMTKGGIHAANTKITGVADGSNEHDAVNLSQLYKMKFEIEGNSLVKWSKSKKNITIGAEKEGIEINIANSEGRDRIISGVAVGKVSSDSTEAINGHQLFSYITNIVDFFGGEETDILNGIKPTFTVQKTKHDNVTDAFAAVDTSITDIYSQINNVTESSLVKWKEDQKLITIGKEKGGTKIDITGTEGERTIAGVKNGKISEDSTEAINGSQVTKISGDVAKFFGGDAAFQDGAFVGPRYNLSTVSADGSVEQKTFENVGDALTGLDANVKNVNSRLTHVVNNFTEEIQGLSKDALLWSSSESAFVALHEKDGQKIDSKIKFLANGDISGDSTDAINGSQLYKMGDKIANYFGGGARYENGEWSDPTFKVSQRNEDGTIVEKKHHNVADAFEGVDNSITDIYNQINNVTENSLVKQEGEDGLITVGKATGGTEISLVNKDKQERTLSGIKDGEISQASKEAVNGSQLFATNKNITTVNNDLKTVAQNTSKYFGGSTDVLEGIKPAFLIDGTAYDNVTDAFTGVNISIHKIDDKISDVVKNSLVKQDGGASGVITIGKDTAGTEINIAGYAGVARSISGVKAAEKGDEAVNKDQLDKSIKDITKDIETVTATAVLYDKNDDNSVNYGSVTLGGDKNNGPVALRNVKNGSISENSNDAINGSQINKISADIAKFFGGGAKFINGAFEGLKYTLSAIVGGEVGKANFYNVGDALTGLDKNVQDVNQRLTNVSNEFNQKIEDFSKDALLWDDDEEAFVARHEKDGQKTKSKLKYLLDGEIAEGSTDAITGNQLYLMSNKLANYFGGGAKYENGKWTDPTFKIVQVNADGTTVEKEHHNVAEAIGGVNGGMVNINNRINDVINKVDSDVLHWNKEKGAYDANHDGQPSKIINVADGKVEKGSKDAVNGGQLWETNERITGVEKDVQHLTNRVDNISNTIADIGDTVINIDAKVDNINNRVDNIEEDAVRYDRDENGKKTNKITLAGGDASEPVLIDNVSDGKIEKGSKEAVNGGQLHDYTQEQMKIILDQSKQYTDQRVNNIKIDAIDDAVDRAKQYTDMRFDVLNYSIENVKKEARQAAAIGLAVSNLRYNDTPGKLSVGFGTGLWRSQSAFAFGAGYTSENGKYRSNISATTSGGHWGVGAGFNMTLN
ncbi:Vomp family autotransporter [Bartonella sp. AC535YNZD]|uniref:Vomp family autotransporter n=1 Tax=Bartonella sp. AC535YNZD TaxID=3243455 RepID=UPI0035CF47C1